MSPTRSVFLCLVVAAVVAPAVSHAQVSARDRESAAQAYDRGTAAYLAEDYERAAQWFETANRLAPAPAALVQAVRSHSRAGNATRAATLALQLQALYADDQAASRTAASALSRAGTFLRVDVDCDRECTIEAGGAIMGHTSFFLTPGEDHEIVASFGSGSRRETVSGAAGQTLSLQFEAPEEQQPDPVATEGPTPTVETSDSGGGGVPLGVTIASFVVTAGLGGVLIWSGVDTLDGVPAYEADPTTAGLADGRSREERTNWLIAGTSVAGALTAILLIFTDWGSDDGSADAAEAEVEVEAMLEVQPMGLLVGARGSF